MQLRDVLGVIYADASFAPLFARCGRPAESPWRLALVTIMQFAEGLSDRQAAEAVRARIDWKYALGLALTDPGFDFSVLCEFHARLIQGADEQLLLDALPRPARSAAISRHAAVSGTDATQVLGVLRLLSRLEQVAETLRHNAAQARQRGARPRTNGTVFRLRHRLAVRDRGRGEFRSGKPCLVDSLRLR